MKKQITRKRKVRQMRKSRRGGGVGFSRPKTPRPGRVSEFRIKSKGFSKDYPAINIRDIDNLFDEIKSRIKDIQEYYSECRNICLNHILTSKEPLYSKDIYNNAERMSTERPSSEFINFCTTSIGITDKTCTQIPHIIRTILKAKFDLNTEIGLMNDSELKSEYIKIVNFIDEKIKEFENRKISTS